MPHRRATDLSPKVVASIERSSRLAYRLAVGYITAIGFVLCLSAMAYFASPDYVERSPIGRNLSGGFDEVWNGMWLIGGACIMLGTMWPKDFVELVGHALFVAALIPYLVAVHAEVGFPPGWFLALALGVAGLARIVYLLMFGGRTNTLMKGVTLGEGIDEVE